MNSKKENMCIRVLIVVIELFYVIVLEIFVYLLGII